MPATPPTGAPTIGMTKKPTTAPAAPATSEVSGAPRAAAERAGSRYFVTVPTASSAVSRPRTVQRTAPPPSAIVHHRPAAQISSRPGITGSSTPIRPAAMTSPTSSCSDSPTSDLPSAPTGRRSPPRAPTGGAGSAAARADPRTVRGADAGQVQGDQQQAEEHQR